MSEQNRTTKTVVTEAQPPAYELSEIERALGTFLEFPTNHPFLEYQVACSEDCAIVYLGIRNFNQDGKEIYDYFGTKSSVGIVPLSILLDINTGRSVKEKARDALKNTLLNTFISYILHNDTAKERAELQIYDPNKKDPINWQNFFYYIRLFTKELFFLRTAAKETDTHAYLLVEQLGTWRDHRGYVLPEMQGVSIPFVKEEMLAMSEHIFNEGGVVPTNDVLKAYAFNQFTNWVHQASTKNVLE